MMKWYEILWQLPQYIIGMCYLYLHYDKIIGGFMYNGASYFIIQGQRGSVTFCKDYIFLSKYAKDSNNTIRHEYGHTIQSRWLGWLYLIVIGLPSIVWAFIHSNFMRDKPYRSFYTEAWADKLGGN